jgi:hypothetical protein
MSGGHFQYKQWEIQNIADEVEQLILTNNEESVDTWDNKRYSRAYSPETIEEFKRGMMILRQAYVYAQRIDWLVSGDDGEDSFHRRLKLELDKLKDNADERT